MTGQDSSPQVVSAGSSGPQRSWTQLMAGRPSARSASRGQDTALGAQLPGIKRLRMGLD